MTIDPQDCPKWLAFGMSVGIIIWSGGWTARLVLNVIARFVNEAGEAPRYPGDDDL